MRLIDAEKLISDTMAWVDKLKVSPDADERNYADSIELYLVEHMQEATTVNENVKVELGEIEELKEKNTVQKMYKSNPNIYCCPECGEEIQPMWSYCPWCGQHVTDS